MKRIGPIPYCDKCKKDTIDLWRIEVNGKLLCPACIDKYLNKIKIVNK